MNKRNVAKQNICKRRKAELHGWTKRPSRNLTLLTNTRVPLLLVGFSVSLIIMVTIPKCSAEKCITLMFW